MPTQLPLTSATASQQPFHVESLPPLYIKYMGSKAKIIEFVLNGMSNVYDGGGVCDLFAGSCFVGGALRKQAQVYSNDIQAYSAVLGSAYLLAWRGRRHTSGRELVLEAEQLVKEHARNLPDGLEYRHDVAGLKEFNVIEERNRTLIERQFPHRWHLFLKYYSGTWWSAAQCLWIDALREVIERHATEPEHPVMFASLLHAMAYCSQGTGHYAQYRDANTESSMEDISIYRQRSLIAYFERKFDASVKLLDDHPPLYDHQITTLDFNERLRTLPTCTVYADPPYCFVHYSRFYHAIETVVKYDYPEIQVKGGEIVKGRYREDRHQSPFCIRSKVPDAFRQMFEGVAASGSNLALSYSNTGMISLDELRGLAEDTFGACYDLSYLNADHRHMTMGRKKDRDRSVEECLFLAKRRK